MKSDIWEHLGGRWLNYTFWTQNSDTRFDIFMAVKLLWSFG
jgi:hypothetical protein